MHNRKFDAAISFLFCDECGNYFCTETNMSKKAHDETYSNNHVWAKKSEDDWARHYSIREQRQKRLNKKILKHISKILDLKNMKHADFACAEGVLVETMLENGFHSIGIEIDKNAVKWGKEKGRPLFNESLFDTRKKISI